VQDKDGQKTPKGPGGALPLYTGGDALFGVKSPWDEQVHGKVHGTKVVIKFCLSFFPSFLSSMFVSYY